MLPTSTFHHPTGWQLIVAIAYLGSSTLTGANVVVVYLTILASAASVLTGLFLRLVLCCVLGADRDEDGHNDVGGDDGTEMQSVNPVFGDVDDGEGGI